MGTADQSGTNDVAESTEYPPSDGSNDILDHSEIDHLESEENTLSETDDKGSDTGIEKATDKDRDMAVHGNVNLAADNGITIGTDPDRKFKQKAVIVLAVLIVISGFSLEYLLRDEDSGSEPDSVYHTAVELGGEWFLNNQDDSFLYYEYYPYIKDHSEDGAYDHHSLREMGALWSITMLADFLDDPRYDELALKGFTHFEEHFVLDQDNEFFYVNIVPDKIKLGYSAFAILSLLGMEHPLKEQYLQGFAEGIVYQQNEDGSFRTFFYSDDDTGVDYYPGEALFALMSLYEYNGNQTYLAVAEKAFPYYRDYWRSNNNTAFIAWQSRAYAMLYENTRRPEYKDFVFEMNDYLLNQYFPDENCTDFEFLTSVVSVHMEGVLQAYDLADYLKDHERKECYGNYIREGSDFMLSLQVTEQGNFFEPEIVGGFMYSSTGDEMRVDRNQHAVVALMEAIESGIVG